MAGSAGHRAPSKSQPPTEPSLPFATDGREFKSGLTVFDDRPLRLRSLTLADEGATGLEEPSAEHSAFKIRVAKREGFQQAAGTLIERRYGDRGYQTPRAAAAGSEPLHLRGL